jgi:hypothetical protein
MSERAPHAARLASTADAQRRAGGLLSGDMERELERRGWEAEATANLAVEQAVEERRRQRREVRAVPLCTPASVCVYVCVW